ncbi:MAG: hypothetical protein SO412_05995, partial [Erysipelotrichaceae bacterium]|nr:hypothetical protein [Erysipelotrichaceae bacterium]
MKLKLVIVLTIATLLLSVFALYLVVNVKPEDDIDYLELYQNDYLRLKEKNQDYLGVFTDESFNIDIKVVKGEDNSKYRYYVWEKNNYSFEGSPYFDYENTLDDQNLILYNCYFDDINTDGNYYFFTGDEVREYKLYAIFDVQLVNEDGSYYPEDSRQFNLPYYNEEYFDAYKKALTEGSYYCSGYDPDISDKLFTVVNNTEDDYVKRIFLFVQTDKV